MAIPYCELLVYQMLTHILQRQGSEKVGVLTHWKGGEGQVERGSSAQGVSKVAGG